MTTQSPSPAPACRNCGCPPVETTDQYACRCATAATAPAPIEAPDIVVGLKVPTNGWTGNSDADLALILLDRLDCDLGEDAARIEQLEVLVRKLAAAAPPPAGGGEPKGQTGGEE